MTALHQQLDLFGGREARDAGRSKADPTWLLEARQMAAELCRQRGYVTTDSLHILLPEPRHPNHWGAVLGKPYFESGEFVQTKRKVGHARYIRRWTLTSEGAAL